MRATVRLVWALDARHLTAHRARLALGVFGVAAGVALAVAVSSLGSSIDASLQGIASAAASRANLEVRGTSAVGIGASTLPAVEKVAGVRAAGATVESYARLRNGERTVRALLMGVSSGIFDLAPEAVTRQDFEVVDEFGLFLPQGLADDLGLSAGDAFEVSTPTGWQRQRVGAIVRGDGAGGRIAVGALGVVQN
ncbi:MAG TPA: hypothetical protein VM840_00275, partial [Actinomycetota bacterium]|nr:hypothetical protein [Actinomycetota bacterium]